MHPDPMIALARSRGRTPASYPELALQPQNTAEVPFWGMDTGSAALRLLIAFPLSCSSSLAIAVPVRRPSNRGDKAAFALGTYLFGEGCRSRWRR